MIRLYRAWTSVSRFTREVSPMQDWTPGFLIPHESRGGLALGILGVEGDVCGFSSRGV